MMKYKNILLVCAVISILLTIGSCFYDSSCETWIDSTKGTTWSAENHRIDFREAKGGIYDGDTMYDFGSHQYMNDSFYLYKMWSMERWVAVNVDSTPLHELDRILLGTNFDLDCHSASILINGELIEFDISD